MNELAAAWSRRSAGERRMLAAAAAAAAVLLFAAFVWLPLERARARLEREVPGLRADVAALEGDAQEVRRLRSMPPTAAAAAHRPLAALAAGALAVPPGARLTLADERHLRLAAGDVDFAKLVEWLASTQASEGLRVESARVEALATRGRVRADITLAGS